MSVILFDIKLRNKFTCDQRATGSPTGHAYQAPVDTKFRGTHHFVYDALLINKVMQV